MNLRFREIEPESQAPRVIAAWDELVADTRNLYKMYQAPGWWGHLQTLDEGPQRILVAAEESDGTLVGVVPLQITDIKTSFSFKRRDFPVSSFHCLEVLGSQFLLPENEQVFSAFLEWVWERFPRIQGVYCKSIPEDSFTWRFLESQGWQVDGGPVYRFSVERDFFVCRAAETFEEYLAAQFKKKKRYNLKRQVRLMEEAAEQELRFTCITSPEDVPGFNSHVRAICENSWKASKLEKYIPEYVENEAVLTDVARRGLLRAYLLFLDDTPVTYVLGFQYRDVYHYSDIGFDDQYSRFSPGSVLLFKLIEDLIENTPLKWVNFGIGDSEYKRQFANDKVADDSLLILRGNLRNRWHRGLNETIKQGKEKLRAVLG